ncbi:MAG: class I tRNA ligase family protein, partial [bacterium]|nr:class I tRNA ligase family protein [bacterium]
LYPTSILVTGYEILYLWVARMIMMGVYFMNEVPFKKVIIHGIVRDDKGRKMSKSLGNVVDPLDITKKYGTDALRYAMAASVSIGRDLYLNENMFISGRNFANKIYNACIFVKNAKGNTIELSMFDRWILSELSLIKSIYFEHMSNYSIVNAINEVRNFFWHSYCDWYIEIYKLAENKNYEVLKKVFLECMKIIHPFMPYVTQYCYTLLYGDSLITELCFDYEKSYDEESVKKVGIIKDIVSTIRWLKKELDIKSFGLSKNEFLDEHIDLISALARVKVEVFEKAKGFEYETSYGSIFFDIAAEKSISLKKRLEDKLKEVQTIEDKFSSLISNPNFLTKADNSKYNEIKNKLENVRREKEVIEKILKNY